METSRDQPAQSMETSDDQPAQSTDLDALPLSSETSIRSTLYAPLTDLYDESYELLKQIAADLSAEKVFVELSITDIECQETEKATHLKSKDIE